MIENPYKAEASCQVNCQISTTQAGTTNQASCTKSVAPGIGPVALCTHTIDKGKFVKVIGGSGECTDPTPKPAAAEKDEKDDDIDAQALIKSMPKPRAGSTPSAEEMQKMMDDPDKLQEYIQKQMQKP
jgi:hypothetical protein